MKAEEAVVNVYVLETLTMLRYMLISVESGVRVEYFGYRDSISHGCIPVWIFVSPDMSSSYFQIISTLVV